MLINNIKKAALALVLLAITSPVMQANAQSQVIVPAPKQIKSEPFIQDTLAIRTENGEELLFNIELALTPAQQAKGMMFRTYMANDYGMLFVFDREEKRSFWMKNTLVPLDMLFIKRDGRIHHIHSNATPQDLSKITSEGKSFAVLEIKGGMSDELGIKVEDKVLHPLFRNMVAE